MKIFITEFRVGDQIYEGPYIYAETFEEAETEASRYNVIVVGMLEASFHPSEEGEWSRVLH